VHRAAALQVKLPNHGWIGATNWKGSHADADENGNVMPKGKAKLADPLHDHARSPQRTYDVMNLRIVPD